MRIGTWPLLTGRRAVSTESDAKFYQRTVKSSQSRLSGNMQIWKKSGHTPASYIWLHMKHTTCLLRSRIPVFELCLLEHLGGFVHSCVEARSTLDCQINIWKRTPRWIPKQTSINYHLLCNKIKIPSRCRPAALYSTRDNCHVYLCTQTWDSTKCSRH